MNFILLATVGTAKELRSSLESAVDVFYVFCSPFYFTVKIFHQEKTYVSIYTVFYATQVACLCFVSPMSVILHICIQESMMFETTERIP